MLYEKARTEIARTGVRLEAEGLLSSTAGNISCRVAPQLIAITPTAIPYPEIGAEDVVICDLDRNVVDGYRRPSSELPFHTAVYRAREDVGGVVHTHSGYATTLAIMRRTIPAIHYVIASFGVDEVPLVPYCTFGSDELASSIEIAIKDGTNAALLANHGTLAMGPDLQKAASNSSKLEFLATVYYRSLVVGGGVVLSSEEIDRVIERYKVHGQPRPQPLPQAAES